MKTKLILVFILALLAIATEIIMSASPPQIIEAPVETMETYNEPAPDFTYTTSDKKTGILSAFKGKTVILNFWATWCAPCIKEFPDLLNLAKNNPDNLILLAVSVDENPDHIAPFLKRLPDPAPALLSLPNVVIAADPQKKIAQDLFGTVKYPETFIIGPDLNIRAKVVGEIGPQISSHLPPANKN